MTAADPVFRKLMEVAPKPTTGSVWDSYFEVFAGSPWTTSDVERFRAHSTGFCGGFPGPCTAACCLPGHSWEQGCPGWHGPVTLAEHETAEAERVERERRYREEHEREQAEYRALTARRNANPLWERVHDAIYDHSGYESDSELAADAAMTAVFGEAW